MDESEILEKIENYEEIHDPEELFDLKFGGAQNNCSAGTKIGCLRPSWAVGWKYSLQQTTHSGRKKIDRKRSEGQEQSTTGDKAFHLEEGPCYFSLGSAKKRIERAFMLLW